MPEVTPHPECPFSLTTFELLNQIKNISLPAFYFTHEKDFQYHIESPLYQIYIHLIAQLPLQIIEKVDFNNEIVGLNNVNGVVSYLFPPKESTNKFKTNLFISITQDRFRFGLNINENSEYREKFIENLKIKKVKEIILQHLHPINDLYLRSDSNKTISRETRLFDWLGAVGSLRSATKNIQVSTNLEKETLLTYSWLEIIEHIKHTLERVFILFLVATENDPLQELKKYILKQNLNIAKRYSKHGFHLYEEGVYSDAYTMLDKAIKYAPNLGDAYKYRGKIRLKLEDIEGAISDFTQLLLIQPKNDEVYYMRGHIYRKLNDYNKAIKDYSQAILINPNYALAYYHRAYSYLEFNSKLQSLLAQIHESILQPYSLLWLIFSNKLLLLIYSFQNCDATQTVIEDLRIAINLFEKENDVINYEEAKRLLNTVHPDYSEPEFTVIYQDILSKKLQISENILRRYHLALKTRKFVILSGISGTGKTWLTQAYAEAIGAKYALVPVAPNWTTNEDLLGYLNPIEEGKYHYTKFTKFLEEANEEYEKAKANRHTPRPYHLVLDEMNLARVEYYFAKFLSVMEVRMREGEAEIELAPNKKVLLPPNFYFIGTVNVDETTHSFADKIYDRAQMIELEVNREDLEKYLSDVDYRDILMQIWDTLYEVAPFAFRTLDEIKTYVAEAKILGVSQEEALDEQLLQKILPKVKGADEKVGKALKAFVELAKEKQYKLSLAKAKKMLATFEQYGFTSYF